MTKRRLLGAALLIAATIVLAPLLYAVGSGLFAAFGADQKGRQSYALLETYRDYRPPEVAMASFHAGWAIDECGYEEGVLFPERGSPERGQPWTPYGGYFDLLMAHRRDWDRRLDEMRLERLSAETSAFSSEFLRVCIRQSLFAPLCAGRVSAILSAGDLDPADGNHWPRGLPRPDQSRQKRNICTYLDGIAARRGLPLAARPQ